MNEKRKQRNKKKRQQSDQALVIILICIFPYVIFIYFFHYETLLREMKTVKYQFTNCSVEWLLLTQLTTERDRVWPFRTFRLLYWIPASERKKGGMLDRGCLLMSASPHPVAWCKMSRALRPPRGIGSIGAGIWCFQVYSRSLAWQRLDPVGVES